MNAACIAQLQNEISSLRLSWRIDAAKPVVDSFKRFTATFAVPCHPCADSRSRR